MYVNISFPISSWKVFIYKVPINLQSQIKIGSLVSAPLGRRSKVEGIVIDIPSKNNFKGKIQSIISVNTNFSITDSSMWNLIKWVSSYYFSPIGQVMKAVIPKGVTNHPKLKKNIYVTINDLNKKTLIDIKQSAKQQLKIISYLKTKGGNVALNDLKKESIQALSICKKLEKKNIVKIITKYSEPSFRDLQIKRIKKKINLNDEQKNVVNKIQLSIKKNKYKGFLLKGVTGSGKTEVYIHLADYLNKIGKTSIILLPEISLTPQIAGRFSSVFGKKVAIWHSKMKSNERVWIWNQIRQGKISVVVGTRSAIFTPLPNVGLIIVDEEHDSSFKQENSSPKYNSRDLALVRAKYNNCIALLAGATPSMESYYNQKEKKLSLLEINKRYGKSKNPIINLVDMNLERKNNENRNPIFSQLLIDSIAEKIDKKEQVMLLQNRRGFSILNCNECQEVVMCGQCQIPLTFHKSKNLLICHYCSFKQKIYTKCSKCNNNLSFLGVGTQKIEEALIKLFPTVLIKRMDFDSTRKAGEHSKILDDFLKNKFHILLGTQMIAKGLDFPNVTLVGVINADMNLFIPDFRAGEKTFQLLYQVAGRTGRGEKPGKVVIQTNNPNDVSIFCASKLNLNKYYTTCLNERKELMYPPYSRITKIELSGKFEKTLISIGEKIANEIPGNLKWLEVIGPNPCPIFTLRGKKRYQIILKSSKKMDLNGRLLHDLIRKNLFDKINFYNKKNLQISIDVDPNNLL
ncbi:MAG: primosomal protein N' [Candidatus Marinimicrobia bacterium]|nr:primosomal protein N' [Candidatus Neomarinimicrobiota bacterium]OUW51044.1 MAG: primosomal protein N' [bacterium TMED190]